MTAGEDRGIRRRRSIALGLALLMLVVSLLLALETERQATAERSRQADVQASILANSVTGALAFDDEKTAWEYLNALRLNHDIEAAAIYGAGGALVAGYSNDQRPLPKSVQPHPARIQGLQLTVVKPVRQEKLLLGNVYIRAAIEPVVRRASRYLAIGVIVLGAALLIVILGSSYANVAALNLQLQEQIRAREQAEAELRQSQRMEAMGQLTGGVAHDFNNLLMAAMSGLELFGRSKDPQKRERFMQGVREALDRGARLTQQLLTFSRRAPVQAAVVDVGEAIDNLAELLDRSLREDISVEYDLAQDLWPVEIDLSQFEVAILNLAVNARDAMPDGGRIRISAVNAPGELDGEDAVRIRVEDEGVGMTSEALEKAFEPFFTTKGVGGGTGLGLSQVYGFTQAAHGDISIASSQGHGATVTIMLPRCHMPAEADEPAGLPAADAESLPHLHVLLVEDDDALAGHIGEMLVELGCDFVHASSADEGLRVFEQTPVDFVLSDMVMPGRLNGLDLARQLRQRGAKGILLMTGYSSAVSSAANEGFQVLTKPFTLSDLAGRIQGSVLRNCSS
jgi:signal transduction histidine kinase